MGFVMNNDLALVDDARNDVVSTMYGSNFTMVQDKVQDKIFMTNDN